METVDLYYLYVATIPVNTKHFYNICTMLDQRRKRWADVLQMLYKCFVFTGKFKCPDRSMVLYISPTSHKK